MMGVALSPLVALDLRSLAAFRIGVALCVLWELAVTAADAGAFLTDAGILPRSELLNILAPQSDRAIPFALASGSLFGQTLIIGGCCVAALALLVGYRTRLATVSCWLLLSSIQLRNPFLVFGAGVFLRMLLFWGCFLPLGARLSLDRLSTREEAFPGSGNSIASIATLCLYSQVALVFVIAGLAKMTNPAWREGFGVAYSLDYEPLVTSFGQALGGFPEICFILTYLVVAVELAGPLALPLSAFSGPFRILVIAAMGLMVVGFSLALRVGLFPWVSLVALVAFVPGWLWDRGAARLGQTGAAKPEIGAKPSVRSARDAGRTGLRTTARIAANTVAVGALLFILVWSVGLWEDRDYQAPLPLQYFGDVLNLRQRWGMFTRLPSTGWLNIGGNLRDGTIVDLFAAGGPLPTYEQATAVAASSTMRPQLISATFKSVPWMVFFLSMTEHPDEASGQSMAYGRYLCREWNKREADSKQLESFQMIYWSRSVETTLREHPTADYKPAVLWDHRCFP